MLADPAIPMAYSCFIGAGFSAVFMAWHFNLYENALGTLGAAALLVFFGILIREGYAKSRNLAITQLRRDHTDALKQVEKNCSDDAATKRLSAAQALRTQWGVHAILENLDVVLERAIVTDQAIRVKLRVISPSPLAHRLTLLSCKVHIRSKKGEILVGDFEEPGLNFDTKSFSRYIDRPFYFSEPRFSHLRAELENVRDPGFILVSASTRFQVDLDGQKVDGLEKYDARLAKIGELQ